MGCAEAGRHKYSKPIVSVKVPRPLTIVLSALFIVFPPNLPRWAASSTHLTPI